MMKYRVAVLGLLLSVAQLSFATFTPEYDTYTQFSGDDNYIYQTVIVEGTTTGDCYYTCNCGQYGCQQCTIPNCPAAHTPQIYNVLNGVGGWSYGTPVNMFSYISYQTTTQYLKPSDTDSGTISGSTSTGIDCAAALGLIFATAVETHFIDWGTSRYKVKTLTFEGTQTSPGRVQYAVCNVTPWCSNTSTPFGFQGELDDSILVTSCANYYTCKADWLKVGTPPIFYFRLCTGTIDSSQPVCTTPP
jgi:hypothetical protein